VNGRVGAGFSYDLDGVSQVAHGTDGNAVLAGVAA
jgi:hypothetical protein